MKHSLFDVITGWSFVVFVDLLVLFIFAKIAQKSVLNTKGSPNGENNHESNEHSFKLK